MKDTLKFTVQQEVKDVVPVEVDMETVIRTLNMIPFARRWRIITPLLKQTIIDCAMDEAQGREYFKRYLCKEIDDLNLEENSPMERPTTPITKSIKTVE